MTAAVEPELRRSVDRRCVPGTLGAGVADRMSRGYYAPELLHLFVHKRGGRYSPAEPAGSPSSWRTCSPGPSPTRRSASPPSPTPPAASASEPFYTEAWNAGGRFGWRVPVGLQLTLDGGRKAGDRTESDEVGPGEFPLVAGFTTAARTMSHLIERGGFVDRPSGDDWVTVVVKTPEGAPGGTLGFGSWPHLVASGG